VHGGFVGQSKPTIHRRFIAALPEGLWFVLDEVVGKGRHVIESLVHLAPTADCRIDEAGANVALESVRVRFYPYKSHACPASKMSCVRGQTNPIQGWYAPEFGKRESNHVLTFSSEAPLPARMGYLIAPTDREIVSWTVEVADSNRETQLKVSVSSLQGDMTAQFNI
jgi:hypothetical protein